MLLRLEQTKDLINNMAESVHGALRMGSSGVFAHYILPNMFKGFIEKYPDVSRHLFRTLVERLHKTDRIVVQLAGAAKARPPQVIRQA